MPRWLWYLPLSLILLASALLGYRYGVVWVNMDRGEAAAVWAAHYAREAGGDPATCLALPDEAAWLALRCGADERAWTYRISRFGQLVSLTRGAGI
ncbi:hypothetical protein [Tropicibacter alexandrii]|uniref:hypothetical protein n=1 Tax=Tropicibacter alexandrii TaxID=2267683 RepID=UPI000EF49030|nr:hypothetical protein [Tropicibacter alexandrii]